MGWLSRLKKKNQNYEEHPLDLGTKTILGASVALWFVGFKFAILKYTTSSPMPDDFGSAGTAHSVSEALWGALQHTPKDIHIDEPWLVPALMATLAIIYRMKQWGWTYWIMAVIVVLNFLSWIWLPLGFVDGFLLEWVQDVHQMTWAETAFFGVEGLISCTVQLICSIVLVLGWWEFRRVRREVKAADGV